MECTRCGTCCRKGGPALHRQDLDLLDRGILSWRHLVTLRRGESVFDQIRGEVTVLEQDIIKLRGSGTDWACVFHRREDAPGGETLSGCAIYQDRPAECRALSCRDTSALEAIYDRDRLTRADLIPPESGLAALVDDFEQTCSCGKVQDLVASLRSGEPCDPLEELVRYDRQLRQALRDKGADARELEIPFGRPLTTLLGTLGVRMLPSGRFMRMDRSPEDS